MVETTEQYRARINQLKTSIENEPLIKKMRDDIAEGVSKTGNRQADIEVRQNTLEDDFVAVQQDASSTSPSGAEVAVARGGHSTLDERLTKKEQEVTAQFAQNAKSQNVVVDIFKRGSEDKLGNGDWSVAIQLAADFAMQNGFKGIKFLSGIYHTSKSLPENVNIFGAGKSETRLVFTHETGYALTIRTSDKNPLRVENITLASERFDVKTSGVLIQRLDENGAVMWGGCGYFKNVLFDKFYDRIVKIDEGYANNFTNCLLRGYTDINNKRTSVLLDIGATEFTFSDHNTFFNTDFQTGRVAILNTSTMGDKYLNCSFNFCDLLLGTWIAKKGRNNDIVFQGCWFESLGKGIINAEFSLDDFSIVDPLAKRVNILGIYFTNNIHADFEMPQYYLNPTIEPTYYKYFNLTDQISFNRSWKKVTSIKDGIETETIQKPLAYANETNTLQIEEKFVSELMFHIKSGTAEAKITHATIIFPIVNITKDAWYSFNLPLIDGTNKKLNFYYSVSNNKPNIIMTKTNDSTFDEIKSVYFR